MKKAEVKRKAKALESAIRHCSQEVKVETIVRFMESYAKEVAEAQRDRDIHTKVTGGSITDTPLVTD